MAARYTLAKPLGLLADRLHRAGAWLYSAYAWSAWSAHLVVFVPFTIAALEFRPASALGVARAMCRSLLRAIGVRLEIRGVEQLDPHQAYLYVCNHTSRLDAYILAASLPQRAIGIEHDTNFRYPFYGLLITRWGNIPISHEDHHQAMAAIARAAALYRQGQSLVIFPEGRISTTGEIGPFKIGGFRLAVETRATIVPVTIRGAHEVSPGNRWWIRPGRVSVTYGRPIPSGDRTVDALRAAIRDQIVRTYAGRPPIAETPSVRR